MSKSKYCFLYCSALSVIMAIASAAYFFNDYLGETYSKRISTYCLSVSLIIALLAIFPTDKNKSITVGTGVKEWLWLLILAITTPVLSILTSQLSSESSVFMIILVIANAINLTMIAITTKQRFKH